MRLSTLSAIVLRALIPAALTVLLAFPGDIFAQSTQPEHLVSPQTLQQQVESASHTRQQNIKTITDLLNTPIAERAMRDAHYDPIQVKTAVPTLSDQELASLAVRATDVQQKISGGVLGFGLITLLVIALIIIIVVAIVH
ncbi:MAG TPA: hypothetical protein VFB43_08920 [Terracidiphilus sp.]|nr:hypothetical protein [Terracidiphilus sp.]